jgi:multidrug efflux pump
MARHPAGEIDEDNPGLTGHRLGLQGNPAAAGGEHRLRPRRRAGRDRCNIGRTLETMLGSRRVTTYIDGGEEYDVMLEGERDAQRTPTSLENIYVRSDRNGQLIPLSNLVSWRSSPTRPR